MADVRLSALLGIALLGAACAVPLTTPTPPEWRPSPAADFAEAVSRIEQRQAQDDSVVAPGARSILLSHGAPTPRVFVLLHGFSDSPTQFRTLGERFFANGDNVYIPRLPHHADRTRRVRELGRVRAEELARFGDSTIDIAHALGDTIIVVGLSAGGAIAGHLAQNRSEVYRAVLIAPAIGAGYVSDDAEVGLVVLASKMPDVRRSEPADSTRPDYIQGITTRGLAEVLRLGHIVHDASAAAPAHATAMTVLLNTRDKTVSGTAAIDLARQWTNHGAPVSIFTFGDDARLPHNVLEIDQRGGHLAIVLPVVEALAFGRRPSDIVQPIDIPCDGFECVTNWWRRHFGAKSP